MILKRIKILLLILFACNICIYAGEKVKVHQVIDGDTLKVFYKGKLESIRLIGIDTPENSDNPKARRDSKRYKMDISIIISHGKKATEFVRELVRKGDIVSIEFDVQRRDKYKRLLGYVFLSNDRMLNHIIIRSGYAYVMTIPPNVKYSDLFLRAYRLARQNRAGLWK